MLTLFFTKKTFGSTFFQLEELKEVQPFFKRATHGFKLTSKQKLASELFFKLENSSKLNRLIILLQLLKLTSSANYKSLSSFIYDKKYTDNEGARMRNVFEYTMNHFHENITLETISEIAAMTKNAFCKYFKKRTNKTYIQFLNELRIEHACKQLILDKEITIAQIAEHCGFNNMSNFNRQFKSVKGMTPYVFRQTS